MSPLVTTRESELKPLHKFYFIGPQGSSGEQFYYFAALCNWLLREAYGDNLLMPDRGDDSEEVLLDLFERLKSRNYSVDAAALAEFRRGYGDRVVITLLQLSNSAVKAQTPLDVKPQFVTKDTVGVAPVDDGALITLSSHQLFSEHDDLASEGSCEASSELHSNDDDSDYEKRTAGTVGVSDQAQVPSDIRTIDPASWQAELDRVTPQLKITLTSENKSWRVHQQQLEISYSKVEKQIPELKRLLTRLKLDIETAMQKIKVEETRLNTHFKTYVTEHQQVASDFSEAQRRYDDAVAQVRELSGVLLSVSEELEHVKTEIDTVGSQKNDTNSLVDLKKAVSVLKDDIKALNLRTGIVQHSLLAFKRSSAPLNYSQEQLV